MDYIHNLEQDLNCYSSAVYHEVNTRTLEEKLGVINVIRNRVKSGKWGRTVCDVVYSHKQFAVLDERHEPVNEKAYLKIKLLVLDTVVFKKYPNPVADSLYFHDDSIKEKNSWFGHNKKIKIGRMNFY
jgi:spore germination cell wall hydrolase CwlJ-like protein